MSRHTGWWKWIWYLIVIGCFPQKNSIITGSFAESDMILKESLSLLVIFHKETLKLLALLRKVTCCIRLSMHICHPVTDFFECTRIPIVVCCSVYSSELQWVAVSCSELQWVVMSCSEFQWVAVWCDCFTSVTWLILINKPHTHFTHLEWPDSDQSWCLQCVAVCCSVLQCVALCCSVLQCAAVCGMVLRYVAVCCSMW